MKETVKELAMDWPIGQDGAAKTLASFKCNGYPTYCLVDRKGRLRVNDADLHAIQFVTRRTSPRRTLRSALGRFTHSSADGWGYAALICRSKGQERAQA